MMRARPSTRTLAMGLSATRRLLSSGSGDYLQNTKIPTYHFQDSLPRLPIPDLKDTADRYLKSAAPLLTEAEQGTTKKAMEEFTSGIGKKLHEDIVARDKSRYSSFISDPWFDMYLRNRDPLVLNINPQITMKEDLKKTKQTSRAASVIVSSVRFYKTLRDEKLVPDMFHTQACMGGTGTGFFKFLNGKAGTPQFDTVCSMIPKKYAFYGAYLYGTYPLDMSQYTGLFNSTRVPLVGKDQLVRVDSSRHIVVQFKNDFWKLDVITPDGGIVPAGEIMSALDHIKKQATSDTPPVGIMTAMERDMWAKTRASLIENPTNKQTIADIDSALFTVCLEHEVKVYSHDFSSFPSDSTATLPSDPSQIPSTPDYTPSSFVDRQNTMLFGKGRNRWFDKSFQLIFLPDQYSATCAINFEHSWGDGVAVMRYFNDIAEDSGNAPTPTPTPAKLEPKRMPWDLSAANKADIASAEAKFDATINSVDHECFEVAGFDAPYIKSKGLGLDGVQQMVFQLAHFKMYGFSASTYESANQSAYKHGRTETIRTTTIESHKMCQTFEDKSASKADKDAALRVAVKNHGAITKKALMGAGWDRHMFALKYEAGQQGLPLPGIYQDKSYVKLSEIILSTSTLSSPNIEGGGFGPVGQNCYGIGYTSGALRGIYDPSVKGQSGMGCAVMSYKRNTKGFVDSIEQSVKDIREVLGPKEAKK